jgi:hypothetical protein
MVEDLTVGLVDAIAELIAEDALAPLSVLELRLLGGALARTSEGHGALASLDGEFSVFAGGVGDDAAARAAIDDRLDTLRARLAAWITPQVLLNSSGAGDDPAQAFEPEVWERLLRARDAFDPDRLILGSHDATSA